MISNTWLHLYWHTCFEEIMGHPAGSLIVCGYQAGGGFAGAAERIYLCPVANIASPDLYPPLEPIGFPKPSVDVEYIIGGRNFANIAYKEQRGNG